MVLAKFGYLRKEFFFSYLSANSRSTKFRNWKILLDSGFLSPYSRSFIGEDVYKLSNLGKKLLLSSGILPVSSAHPLHFEHDDHVIHLALALRQKELILDHFLSEQVLRRDGQFKAIEIFGQSIEKMPDLLFQVNLSSVSFQVAIEIERTRKSQIRYDAWVQAYAKASHLNLIIVFYNDQSVLDAIQSAVQRYRYPQNVRPIAFCKIKDLQANRTNFPISMNGKVILFENYINNLRQLSEVQSDVLSYP